MNILVTGATGGIGKAVCENLNGKIFATGRNEEILSKYENYCVCDLSVKDDLETLGKYIEANDIDVLINNAGEYIYSPIEEITVEQIEHITKIDFEAPMYLAAKAVPNMKRKHYGRIINIGSISGVLGEAYASLYSGAKSGLIGASKALALELAPYGITVNTINPGWVETKLGNESIAEGDLSKDEMIDCIPQKRFVEPEEVAGMVNYLISDMAKGVTGQSINLCAGLTCGY